MIELRHVSFQYGAECEAARNTTCESAREASCGAAGAGARDHANAGELTDINLSINTGELLVVTGPSGCGKTTILRLINGLIPRFYRGRVQGDILLDGRSFEHKELYDLAQVVGTVFQNPKSQFYNVDTTSELAFACENQGMPEEAIYQRIDATVADLHLENLMDRDIFQLSDGEKQKIACASLEVAGLKVMLLDEPSANLDFDATLMLKKLILHWKQQGRTIVVAEHRIAYLWDIMDRLVVMKQGRIARIMTAASDACVASDALAAHAVSAAPTSRVTQKNELSDVDLQAMGLRTRTLESPLQIKLPSVIQGDRIIRIKNVSFSYGSDTAFTTHHTPSAAASHSLTIPSLAIAQNQITAIVGSNGAGKTTFLNCLCGLEKRCKGRFEYEGHALSARARKALCFMVMQNTANQLFTERVLDEVLISLPKDARSNKLAANKQDDAMQILHALDLASLADRHPQSLSGGQKQRLAIACALAAGRKILLLDEPTSGLDYAHMQELAQLLSELRAMCTTILIVTHDSELIHACCTRLIRI